MGFSEDQFDWELRFVGDHLQLSPSDILERFVSSITCPRSDLIGLWKSAAPVVEYSRSRVWGGNSVAPVARQPGSLSDTRLPLAAAPHRLASNLCHPRDTIENGETAR